MKKCVLFLIPFLFSCSNKQEDVNHFIMGRVDKAYVNFHLPMHQKAKRLLFYECTIHNSTQDSLLFKFPFDIHDTERNGNLYVKFNNNDSVNLYCKSLVNRDFKIMPNQTKKIDFCIYLMNSIYKDSNIQEYLFFLDSLAFVTEEIRYKGLNDSIFTFSKDQKYVMEHRLLDVFTAGEGYRE